MQKLTSMQIQKLIYTKRLAKQFKLSLAEIGVLTTIAVHYNHFTCVCFPSQSTIADILDITRETVNRAVKSLIGKGLVSASGELGESKTYKFSDLFFKSILSQDDQKDTCDFKSQGGVINNHTGCDNKSHKQITKHNNLTVQKNNYGTNYNGIQQGISYPTTLETKRMVEERKNIKRGTPIDLPQDEALEWLDSLIPELSNSYFAREVRKKWNITTCHDARYHEVRQA